MGKKLLGGAMSISCETRGTRVCSCCSRGSSAPLPLSREAAAGCPCSREHRRRELLAPLCPEQPCKRSDTHVVILWDGVHAQTRVWSVRTSCLEMSFEKAEVRLKNTVCTEAQNISKFKQIFNGNTKKTPKPQTQGTSLANSLSSKESCMNKNAWQCLKQAKIFRLDS